MKSNKDKLLKAKRKLQEELASFDSKFLLVLGERLEFQIDSEGRLSVKLGDRKEFVSDEQVAKLQEWLTDMFSVQEPSRPPEDKEKLPEAPE